MPPRNSAVLRTQVDRTSSVLVDGQSLLSSSDFGWDRPYDWRLLSSAPALASLIQNMVIHEQVLVDSQLLLVNRDCAAVAGLFPGVLKSLRIESELRDNIAEGLDRTRLFPDDRVLSSLTGNDELLDLISSHSAEHIEQFQAAQSELRPGELPEGQMLDAFKHEYGPIPEVLQDTQRTALRAHFYLELSRALDLYYSPHPARAKYFKEMVNALDQGQPKGVPRFVGVAVRALDMLDEHHANLASRGLSRVDFSIPAVAEHVARISVERHVGLHTALMEVRGSKHARHFRRWCAERNAAINRGRAGLSDAKKTYAELEKVCARWAEDVGEGVDYEHREVTWSELPWLGSILRTLKIDKLLKLAEWEKLEVKDPVLWVDKPYLLFLNDLYR